ncbi:MAG: hypothetical protein QOF86_771 [Baekduia sp.]|jgi:hypothetical protein|nr:hypothetical protein [Actinomycetota bacterium]MDX6684643.1 hypothetical protein [Baekduia sp.]
MRTRKLAAVAAAIAPLALAAPVATAGAATTPPASAAAPVFTFIPPRVGPLQVIMGATYIGGKLISPGVNVSTPGVSLPAITWTPPSS